MSIERFLSTYSAGKGLDKLVRKSQANEAESGHPKSLVAALAAKFVQEGSGGLRALSKEIGLSTAPRVEDLLPYRKRILMDTGGILLGNAIITFEETLVERYLDVGLFCRRCNESIMQTFLPRFEPPLPSSENLTTEQWQQALQLAKEDKTLAVFLHQENQLTNFLAEIDALDMPILSYIRSHILPNYKKLADFLLRSN